MLVLPLISICLILTSAFISIRNKKERKDIPPQMILLLNGVILLSLVMFVTSFLQNENVVTQIPFTYYWFLMFVGIAVEAFAIHKKYAPGHITAAAIHIFVGFVAIFSIGFLLLVLALFELGMAFYQNQKLKKLGI